MSRSFVLTVAVGLLAFAAALALWSSVVPSDDSCPTQFAGGQAPEIDRASVRSSRTLCFSQFALRYSEVTKTPLWSAEHLTSERLRAASGMARTGSFHAEARIPAGWRSELSDYRRTGYDRGHMSPSGDMSTPGAQAESFSLVNMVPQHPCSNQVLWETIERAVRNMAVRQGELFVVTGPVYSRAGAERRIGRGVTVPDQIYKAVYDPVTEQAGAYLAENAEGNAWQSVSIAKLKEITAIDAFPSLADDVKSAGMTLPHPEKPRYKCQLHSSGEVPQ